MYIFPPIMWQQWHYIIVGVITLACTAQTPAEKSLLETTRLSQKNPDSASISTSSEQQNTPRWAVACGARSVPEVDISFKTKCSLMNEVCRTFQHNYMVPTEN